MPSGNAVGSLKEETLRGLSQHYVGTQNPSAPEGGLLIFPSPASQQVTIESGLSKVTIYIYDVVGMKVYS